MAMLRAALLLELNAEQEPRNQLAACAGACDTSVAACGAFVSGPGQWDMVRDLSPEAMEVD